MMKKIVLDLEESFDYDVIGICTSLVDYRLAWEINQILGIKLSRSNEDYFKTNKKGEILSSHSLYEDVKEDQNNEILLIKNKNNGKHLISELEMIDFFLLTNDLRNNITDTSIKLREVQTIQTTVIIDAEEYKSFGQIVL